MSTLSILVFSDIGKFPVLFLHVYFYAVINSFCLFVFGNTVWFTDKELMRVIFSNSGVSGIKIVTNVTDIQI